MENIIKPTTIKAAGNKPKSIEEFIGRVNSDNKNISIARMKSPQGWIEPFQNPDFDEYTVVLKGLLKVELNDKIFEVQAGEAIEVKKGSRVRYSTPGEDGAEYIAVCVPAFTPETVNRED